MNRHSLHFARRSKHRHLIERLGRVHVFHFSLGRKLRDELLCSRLVRRIHADFIGSLRNPRLIVVEQRRRDALVRQHLLHVRRILARRFIGRAEHRDLRTHTDRVLFRCGPVAQARGPVAQARGPVAQAAGLRITFRRALCGAGPPACQPISCGILNRNPQPLADRQQSLLDLIEP